MAIIPRSIKEEPGIIPRAPTGVPSWHKYFFYFALFLLIASIISYFVLGDLLSQERIMLEDLEKELTRDKTPEEEELENRVLSSKKRIEDFSQLIDQHLYSSKVFPLIESLCHPKVWFSQFDFDSTNYKLNLSGHGDSFFVVGQQLYIFEQEDLIENVNLSTISIGKVGGVDFSVELSLNPQIIK